MPEQTFRSPNFFEREIDLSAPTTTTPTAATTTATAAATTLTASTATAAASASASAATSSSLGCTLMLLQCPSLRLCLRLLLASENRLDVLHDLGLRLGHLGLSRIVAHLSAALLRGLRELLPD